MTVKGRSVDDGRAIRVEIERGKIESIVAVAPEAGLPLIAPAFFDLQVNGYRGLDYSAPDLEVRHILRIIDYLARAGTSRHLPTIITGHRDRIVKNLGVLADARRRSAAVARSVPGYHIEGPFISPEDGPRGAHSRQFIRPPDIEEFQAWQEAAEGLIRIVTLAPELPGALRFIETVARSGVLVAIGHSAASPGLVRDAVSAGARLSTHLGNGSHAQLPRLKNYLWEQLAADELAAGIISDGFHLPSSVLKTFARAKGLDRLFLVSDVAIHGGRRPGVYSWGGVECEVFDDGHIGLRDSPDLLAGAGHLLDWDLPHFIRATGMALADALRLCTSNPYRLLDLEPVALESPGSEADLVLFDYDERAERLIVRKTIRAGELVFEG